MSNELTVPILRKTLERIADHMEECAEELNTLDAQLGDGDLGVTMTRGCRAIKSELPNLPDELGIAFMRCAQAFTKASGSTYGTLLATGLMSAAKATKGKSSLPWSDISALLGDALAAMSGRGGGQLGDKTVLDTIEAVREQTSGISDPKALSAASSEAVRKCLEEFRSKPARQGRARIFADKSIGMDDPGMIAFYRIVEVVNKNGH